MKIHMRLFLVFSFFVLANLPADQVVLSPVRDNTIYEGGGTVSNGKGQYLHTGENGNALVTRALLAFDVNGAGIPPRVRATNWCTPPMLHRGPTLIPPTGSTW
jgi:hypothetical protein